VKATHMFLRKKREDFGYLLIEFNKFNKFK
jgi:hypothetical protein